MTNIQRLDVSVRLFHPVKIKTLGKTKIIHKYCDFLFWWFVYCVKFDTIYKN